MFTVLLEERDVKLRLLRDGYVLFGGGWERKNTGTAESRSIKRSTIISCSDQLYFIVIIIVIVIVIKIKIIAITIALVSNHGAYVLWCCSVRPCTITGIITIKMTQRLKRITGYK